MARAMRSVGTWLARSAVACCVLAGAVGTAGAAVPGQVTVEGLLMAAGGGGPVADGNYAIQFRIYGQQAGGEALWSEAAAQVPVAGGLLTATLGGQTAIPATLTGAGQGLWLGVQVGADPELPRKPLLSSFQALRAAIAEGLACTGCVTEAMLAPELLAALAQKKDLSTVASSGNYSDLLGIPDLSGYAKAGSLSAVAFSGAFADLEGGPDLTAYAKTADLAKVATSGSYADVTGGPKLNSACGTGLVVKGLKADGSLDCVAALDPTALPADGLNEISNNLLTNEFEEKVASSKVPIDIPDNNPVGVSDTLDIPDFGTAKSLTVNLELTNSDMSKVKVVLFDPASTQFVLYDKGAVGTTLKTSWPVPSKTVSGDLGAWAGKNPKGKWSLTVMDTGFLNNTKDGKVVAWSIVVSTVSNQRVVANGRLVTDGGLQLQRSDKPPVTCDASNAGYMYFDTVLGNFYGCNGKNFVAMSGGVTPKSCAETLTLDPSSVSGTYTIDPDGTGPVAPFPVLCDMTTDGGGWTVLARLNTNDGTSRVFGDTAFWNSANEVGTIAGTSDYLSKAYDLLGFTKINLSYKYQGPATIAVTYASATNTNNLRKNLNLAQSNANPVWTRTWSSAALATQFFGPELRFQTVGNDTDYSRIWYNLVGVGACNQGGSIGHIGDAGSNNWTWEVARGSDLDPVGCQHNTYRLGVGTNYDRKSWGVTDVQPVAFYNEGVMTLSVK